MKRSLKPDVHFYEITVRARNQSPGPTSTVLIRFYPILAENSVSVQTQDWNRFDEQAFADELSILYGNSSSVIINDVAMVTDDSGNPTNQVK